MTNASSPAAALPEGAYWYTVLDLPHAWEVSLGAGVTVAVVDSGVQATLGDLKDQVLPGLDLSSDQRGAQVDAPKAGTERFGHGSDMAALIAGTGKGAGMVGVAPQAKILPVNADDSGHRAVSNTAGARGVRWAVDHGAKVINLSFAGAGRCDPLLGEAVAYAYRHDVLVLAGAGDYPTSVYSPANCPGAIAVGGVDAAFQPWVNTPPGPEVDFVAPAFNLVNEELDNTLNGPYPDNAGTSQATAIVSGTFALLRAKFPQDTARQIVARALNSVHNGLGPGHLGQRINDTLGYGEILPYFALTQPLPANAKNPIFDRFDAALGGNSASGSNSPPGTSPASSPAPSASGGHQIAENAKAAIAPGFIVAIVAGAALLVLLFVMLFRRRGSHGAPAPPPPPPPPPYQGPP